MCEGLIMNTAVHQFTHCELWVERQDDLMLAAVKPALRGSSTGQHGQQ